MTVKDIEVECFIRRLYEARDIRRCELTFDRHIEDIQSRLEMVDDPEIWKKYRYILDEKFRP